MMISFVVLLIGLLIPAIQLNYNSAACFSFVLHFNNVALFASGIIFGLAFNSIQFLVQAIIGEFVPPKRVGRVTGLQEVARFLFNLFYLP